MKINKLTLIHLISFLSISVCFAQSNGGDRSAFEKNLANSQMLSIQSQLPDQPLEISSVEIKNVGPEAIAEIYDKIPDNSRRQMLVSTDSPEVFNQVEASATPSQKSRTKFLIFKKTKDHVLEYVQREGQVRFFVVTINTMYDSFLWIHAESVSVERRTIQTILTIILAGAFGYNQDNWTKMTRPLEGRIFNLLSSLSEKSKLSISLWSKFLANAAFSTALQATRMGVMVTSMDRFWVTAGTSIAIGTLLAASHFSWSEQLAKIKEEKNPVAKNMFRRLSEVRSLIMGHMAASQKILQPDMSSWLALAIHGGLGLFSLLKTDRWLPIIETNPTVIKIYKRYEKLDAFLGRDVRDVFSRANRCQAIFAD